jgi:tetratricopeptide (TPR) repeat protein
MLRLALAILLFTSLTVVSPAQATDTPTGIETGKTLLKDALESNDREKLDKAAAIFQTEWDRPGSDQASMVVEVNNTAQLYQAMELQKESLDWWRKLSKIEPENWRAWAKIVQCSQALGLTKERDEAREKVFALNRQGKVEQKFFVCEQFTDGDKRIMSLEYFKPETKLGVMVTFRVMEKNSPDTLFRRYTLGEIESDTQIARELKEIGPNDHMYSIDGFNEGGQWLITMTTKRPTYEELRAMVLKDLAVERKGAARK